MNLTPSSKQAGQAAPPKAVGLAPTKCPRLLTNEPDPNAALPHCVVPKPSPRDCVVFKCRCPIVYYPSCRHAIV